MRKENQETGTGNQEPVTKNLKPELELPET